MLRRIFVVTIKGELIKMYDSKIYGKIRFKLADILEKENMSKNHLSVISNVRFDTIGKYVKGDIERVDLDIICRFCKALNCKIEDIIEY